MDWSILYQNQNYFSQSPSPGLLETSNWFSGQWSGFKPKFGWFVGGSYDISDSAEFDLRLKNSLGWGGSTIMMLGFNTRF
jgi:hypothetical protein